eukprot:1217148-Pyramimonas_sp.AAC.1
MSGGRLVPQMVLGTDMSNHFSILEQFSNQLSKSIDPSEWDAAGRESLLKIILHCAGALQTRPIALNLREPNPKWGVRPNTKRKRAPVTQTSAPRPAPWQRHRGRTVVQNPTTVG